MSFCKRFPSQFSSTIREWGALGCARCPAVPLRVAIAMTQAGLTHLPRTSYELYPTGPLYVLTWCHVRKRDSRTRRTTAVGGGTRYTRLGGIVGLNDRVPRAYLSSNIVACSLFSARTCRSINSPSLSVVSSRV